MSFANMFPPPTTSSEYIIEALTSCDTTIDIDKAADMRREYLQIMDNESSFKSKKDLLYFVIVRPVLKNLSLKATSHAFQFEVINKVNKTSKSYHMNNKMVTMGRLKDNDIFLCDDENQNLQVSRMQGYMFVAGDKIVYLDIWSLIGTVTVQRSDTSEKCLSTVPQTRNILMFDKNEIIHLKMGDCIDLLIIPKNANKNALKLFPIDKYRQEIDTEEKKNNENVNQLEHKKLNQKQKEFKDWVCDELALEEYYNIFINNGFDDIEVVKLLNDNDLNELGIEKKGSRMKILLYSQKCKQNIDGQNEGMRNDTVE